MRNKVQILFTKIMLCVFLLINLTGCWGGRELNELKITIGLGVDKSKTAGNVMLTAQIVKPGEAGKTSSDGKGGGGSNAFWNISNDGKSIFDAVRNMTKKTGYRIYVSHTQIIVFGNEIALEGLEKYYDFFMRANEIRPKTLILISQGTASDILNVKSETEKLNSMHIANLVKGYGMTSQFKKINLDEFANALMSDTTAPIAPLIGISRETGEEELLISGMAVFINAKMIGTLDPVESRGLLWVSGDVKSGVIEVPVPGDKGKAVLEIMDEKTKLVPKIEHGKISFDVEIQENSSIAEQTCRKNLTQLNMSQELEKEQADIIRKEVMRAFKKSQELNADIFGFGEQLHKKYPAEWKELKVKWDKIYPSIQLTVKAETKIRGTDDITKPAAPEKGGA